MKKILLLFFLFILSNTLSQTTITLDRVNGAFIVPCKVNGVPMNFIFDTGATDVTISLTEAEFLVKQGLLKKEDIKVTVQYQIASGEIREGTKINLREIEINGLKLNNISATIVHEQNAPLLLGMSALSQLGKIEIENNKLIINDFRFSNTSEIKDIDDETKKTIEWINYHFVKYQYETNDVSQKQVIYGVEEVDGIFYLVGRRVQETSNVFAYFNRPFIIPLNKINNVGFVEKQYNYWLEIKMKNYEKAIVEENSKKEREYTDKIGFILSKSLDEQNIRPKLIRAFEYLIKLYEKQVESNKKVVKYEVEDGYVEHIGEMLEDGYVKKSYDKQNRLEAKQEFYIDKNDKVKELKIKTTIYNPITGVIKHTFVIPGIMFENQYIGEYNLYYDNGNIEVRGEFYDFFKNGYEVYFGRIRVGTWYWYLENGEIDGEEKYIAKLEHWEDGSLKTIYGLYYDSNENTWIRHGAYYEFNKNDLSPHTIKEYRYGELVKYQAK